MKRIAYSDIRQYKYRLERPYHVKTSLRPQRTAASVDDYVVLRPDGLLTFKKGYAWDGCSGPTRDDKTNQRAGLVHDGLYQLMRTGQLPYRNRDAVDELFRHMLLQDGMWKFRANYYHWAVSTFAAKHAKPGGKSVKLKVKWAP